MKRWVLLWYENGHILVIELQKSWFNVLLQMAVIKLKFTIHDVSPIHGARYGVHGVFSWKGMYYILD